MKQEHTPRLAYLDTVRGLAAVSVICGHFVGAYGLPRWSWALTFTPLHAWWDGSAAVSLFFVLSGLVLSLRYFRTPGESPMDRFQLGGYVVQRVCRIWLPYLVVLGFSAAAWFVSAKGIATKPPSSAWFAQMWVIRPTVRNVMGQAFALAGSWDFTLVPQAWTLAVEIVLSLLVPAGILLASRSTLWMLFSAIVAAGFAGASPFVFHFAVGIALAKHFREVTTWVERHVLARSVLAAGSVVLYSWRYLFFTTAILHKGNCDWYASGMGAAGFLVITASSQSIRTFFSAMVLRHIGRASYSLYLCHFAVLFCLTPRLIALIDRFAPGIAWGAGLALTVIASIAISLPLYRVVEAPAIELGRFLATAIAKKRVESPQSIPA